MIYTKENGLYVISEHINHMFLYVIFKDIINNIL